MYHRGHSNQTIGYNNQHSNMKRINAHKLQYNVTLSPHSYNNNISISPRSSSPTLSYELPYQLQHPLSHISTRKNKSKTPKQMQFMSKITEESKPNTIITTPSQHIPLRSSPSPSPIPIQHKKGVRDKTYRRNCADNKHNKHNKHNSHNKHKHKHKHSIHKTLSKTRHYSDDDTNTNQTPKIANSTSNRSYRKYKTRSTKQKTHKKTKKHREHKHSESHELYSQTKHRNTKKKTDKNSVQRKKNRAQSTVLSSENNNIQNNINHRPETAKYNIKYDYEYEYGYEYSDENNNNNYESKQSSQDSYMVNRQELDNKRPQTARPQRKSKHHKIRSNGTIITKSTKKLHSDNHSHYKSHSHGNKNHNIYQKQKQKQKHKQSKTKTKKHKIEKIKNKMKKLNFNEGAMDYMSAEQQLLYLYDYTSANVINRSSASTHTTHTTHTTSNTNTSDPTITITPKTNTYTYTSDRDGYFSNREETSVSNRRNGNNSDAITPRSLIRHNHVCSSPIAISYPIDIQRDNTPDTVQTVTETNITLTPRIKDNSLQFLASPPLSAITGIYSQLSTRAVTYSPAEKQRHNNNNNNNNNRSPSYHTYNTHTHTHTPTKHTQQHRDDTCNEHEHSSTYGNYLQVYNKNYAMHRETTPYIESETQLPKLPSPHYLFKLDSNSENDFPITPFNKNDIEYTHISNTNPTIIIHDENSIQSMDNEPIIIDHNQLLEIPASLTAEESGACYLEGESNILNVNISDISTMENITENNELNLEGMDCDDTDIDDSIEFPTTPPIYRLYINDQQWKDVVSNSNPKTPSHRLTQQLLRNSKLQCTV